ncbi:MAG: hypothetical protein B7Y27_01775 [Hydrogenophilales bacterium 16-64-40]|nr:MAG: hypothetical protein B7Y27_01775 [Hydrogenophilales bacterium 16-64-40]
MSKNPQAFIAAMPGAIRRGWRGLSARKRTFLALAFWVLAWQGVQGGLRLMERPALSGMPMTLLSGESTTLAALADGKPLVVNLWASWCPPCRPIQRYLSASRLDLANVILDRDTRLGFVAGSGTLPLTLFYDAGGRLVATHLGALSAASLASKLNPLRAH